MIVTKREDTWYIKLEPGESYPTWARVLVLIGAVRNMSEAKNIIKQGGLTVWSRA